ncbi:PP2C family protein-serine/threonine phosphatase [Streptomyces phaeochromogenes]
MAVVIMVINGVRHQHRELERVRKRLALLDRAATRIGTTLRVDDTCAEPADFLSSELADMAAVMMYPAPHGSEHLPEHHPPPERHGPVLLRMAGVAAVPHLQDYLVEIRATVGEQLQYRHGSSVQRCLDSGRPVVENQLSAEELSRSIPDMEHFPAHRAVGVHSDLVVPPTARGHLMGVVVLVRVGDSPPFEHQDVVMAQDLVGRAAIGLDNARRHAREHGIAVELQRALLPEGLCPRPGIEVATRYLPAGDSALVGGDWYDVIPMSRRRTLLAMGDVMGHGVEAAVAMSRYRAMLRVVAADGLPPHAMLERLDELITRSGTDRPATCLLVLADPENGECLYTSAGHLPPAILAADGRVGLFPVPVGCSTSRHASGLGSRK